MDQDRAWKLWEAGQQLDLLIDGQLFAGSFIKHLNISSSLPTTAEILLPTRVGERQKIVNVMISRIEEPAEQTARERGT